MSTGWEGFALARVDTNMIRASTRSAVSHLHVVASQPATSPDDAPLIERAVELGVLAGAVRRLADGAGGVVVLDAPAGMGKTALLERAALFAADSGCLVRRAAPGPLERHFPFGVVRALLEAPLREASGEERAQLLDGAAAAAGTLLLEGAVPSGDATMLLAHSVLWLCAAIADRRPLALVVDDAQWADRSSLEVLAYLARRIDDLPLLIAVGARADDPRAPSDLLSLLGGVRSATVLHPQPLTAARRGAADPPPGAGRVGGGVPRLPSRRRRATRGCWASSAARSPRTGPNRSTRPATTHRRSPRSPATSFAGGWPTLSARDRAVAAALAVVGDGAPPHVVAAVAGVPVGELGPARDALLAAGLLDAGGERLAHGLVAAADRRGPRADRVRTPASRGGARADGRPRRCRRRRQPPAAVPARRPIPTSASCSCAPRRRRRGAARRTPPRPTSSARSRSARRATTAVTCSRSWRCSPSTPACPTRGGACSRRCTRCATARAASTCSRAWPRSTSWATATPITPSCSSRSWRGRPIPTRGSRSRPRRSTR